MKMQKLDKLNKKFKDEQLNKERKKDIVSYISI